MTKAQQIQPNKEDFIQGLNKDQTEVFNALLEFCDKASDRHLMCIQGYAGTGKTYVISRFFSYFKKTKAGKDAMICLTAPTNKAVSVLKNSTPKEFKEMLDFNTIHSLLGVKAVITESGDEIFTRNNKGYSDLSRYKFVVIDETSMLDDELFHGVLDCIQHPKSKNAPERQTKPQTKIIFMGDPKQIPPINKVDCEPFLNPEYYMIETHYLNEIMRQKDGNMIIEASYFVRENITAKHINFNQFHRPGQLDVKNLSTNEERLRLKEEFINIFSGEDYKSNPEKTKVIAYTNRKVDEYNKFIRTIFFGVLPESLFVVNERVITNSPVFDGETIIIPNSTEMKVLEVKEVKHSVDAISPNKDPYPAIDSYLLKVEFFDIDADKNITYEVFVPTIHGKTVLQTILNGLADIAKKQTNGFKKKMAWEKFYKVKQEFADLSYAYAITAHKSQGSTYNNVYVDITNINQNQNIVERNRIIYTSITRASEKSILLINK